MLIQFISSEINKKDDIFYLYEISGPLQGSFRDSAHKLLWLFQKELHFTKFTSNINRTVWSLLNGIESFDFDAIIELNRIDVEIGLW